MVYLKSSKGTILTSKNIIKGGNNYDKPKTNSSRKI